MTTDSNTHLTHLDESGNIHMVDVTDRPETLRESIAKARVRLAPHTIHLIETNQVSKGSVLEVAKIAGIMAAKQTSQLIPLCHPLPMTHIDLQFTVDSAQGVIHIEAGHARPIRLEWMWRLSQQQRLLHLRFTICVKEWIQLLHLNRRISLVKAGEKAERSNLSPNPLENKHVFLYR